MNSRHRFMQTGGYLLACVFSLLFITDVVAQTASGITLQSTRVIYPENKKKGVTFTLKNDTSTVYLIQSKVVNVVPGDPSREKQTKAFSEAPFMVLPPLKRLDADEQLTLTIRQTKKSLPSDRESVFSLQIKAIPAKEDGDNNAKPGEVKVMLALQNTLKLFYRPEQLPVYTSAQIADSLQFVKQGDQLVVNNGAPYYVTFKSLAVGHSAVDANQLFQMIPPFGRISYPLSAAASGEIHWQLINDYGQASEAFRRPLTQ